MVEKTLSRRGEARRRALLKDYMQLVADLIENGNEAPVDIAARLGVAQPTVAKMLTRPTVLPEPPRCRGV